MLLYKISTYLRSENAVPIWSEYIKNRVKPEAIHTHNCIEIMHIRSGAACCRANDRIYPVTRGDIYVFAPDDIHAFSISGQLTFDNLLFSPELFSPEEIAELQENKIFNAWCTPGNFPEKKLSLPITSAEEFDHAFDELNFECERKNSPNKLLLKALLTRLLCMIFRKGISSGKQSPPATALQLSSLFDYIANNYSSELTLEKLAAAAKVSPGYLNEFMHRTIGQGAMEYLLRYRVEQAQNALEHTNKSIAEIAVSSGFYDTSHLIRTFRNYTGMTPGQYRKQLMCLPKK